MPDDQQRRRQQLWRRHLVFGEDLSEVISDLTTEFDVDEQTIHEDLATIDKWFPQLNALKDVGGISLLAEVRLNRQQLHQLAGEAQDAGERGEELRIRKEINRALNLERQVREGTVKTNKFSTQNLLDEAMDL